MEIAENVVPGVNALNNQSLESPIKGNDYQNGLQIGLDRALDKIMGSSQIDKTHQGDINSVQDAGSPMSMLKDRVSNYIEQEKALDSRLEGMSMDPSKEVVTASDFREEARTMLSMQVAYNHKSLNGAVLLSTAKSSEGFVKTLMRSQ